MKWQTKKKTKNLKMKKAVFLLFGIILILTFLNLISARQITCSDNPTQLWHLNEGNGTNAEDSCYGYNATLNGDMIWVNNGKYRKAVEFNGLNTYLDAGNIYPFNQNMPEFSFSLWINLSNNIAWQSIFRSGYYDPYSEFIELLQLNDGESDFITFMGASSLGIKIVDDSNWHNIIGTFNGTSQTTKLYIDGIYINEYNVGISEITATTTPLYFGFNFDNGFLMIGDLDEVVFFNRTLIQEEITDFNIDYSCSPAWSCSLFNQTCSGVYPSNFECLEVTDSSTCCNNSNLFEDCVYMGNLSDFDFHFVVENLTANVPSYPYVDLNSTYYIRLNFPTNPFSNVKIYLTDPEGNLSIFNFSYIPNYYFINLLFIEEGDYSFVINGTNPCYDLIGQINGVFMVRQPYNITFRFYTDKASTFFSSNEYINEMAFVTAELIGDKTFFTNNYDTSLEPFIAPISDSRYKKPVWYAEYNDGEAILKLYEQGEYAIRLIDGDILFSAEYSVPNITKSYGTNVYVGKYMLTNSTSYSLLLTEKDLTPYRWLLNWIFIILIGGSVVVSMFLFFVIPDKPSLSVIFGLGFICMITLLRVVIFIWKGF